MQKRTTSTRSIDLLASVLQAASLVLPLAKKRSVYALRLVWLRLGSY